MPYLYLQNLYALLLPIQSFWSIFHNENYNKYKKLLTNLYQMLKIKANRKIIGERFGHVE